MTVQLGSWQERYDAVKTCTLKKIFKKVLSIKLWAGSKETTNRQCNVVALVMSGSL